MKENKIIVITLILNFIVASFKMIVGIVFSFSTLIADSVQSVVDFFTDITSLIANRIGKRRANKTYPFGYGQVYYLVNLFTGILLFLIGLFVLYQFFFFEHKLIFDVKLLLFLIIILILKLLVVFLLNYYGSKYKSEIMRESSKESVADLISTLVVLVVLFLSLFEIYMPDYINVDKIGSFGMALFIFYTSLKMIVYNINGMFTNDEDNELLKEDIMNDLMEFKNVGCDGVRIIKMGTYYSVFLKLKVDDDLTIRKYLKLEKKIKVYIKNRNKKIRFIDIELI